MTKSTQDEKTLREIERLYPNEWVLVEETAWDDMEMPVRGRVLAHGPERNELTQEIRQVSRRRPGVKLFSFYTGEKISDELIPILFL